MTDDRRAVLEPSVVGEIERRRAENADGGV
jgi:hypothetical protein